MNRFLFSAVLAVGLLCTTRIDAQTFTYHFAVDNDSLASNVPLNEISARAFRSFVRTYGFIPGAVWMKRGEGYAVSFRTADSVEYTVHYSTSGRLFDTHVFYTAKNAPPEISMAVRKLYTDGDILFVTEFSDGLKAVYQVGILKGDQLRIVEGKNGQFTSVDLLNEYTRN